MRWGLLPALTCLVLAAGCGDDDQVQVWTKDCTAQDTSVIESYRGSSHCDYEDVTFLHVGWPLGSTIDDEARMYVRDPDDVLADQTVTGYEPEAELPDAARATGYSSSVGELWLSNQDQDTVAYLVSDDGDQVEAWPRTRTIVGCD
jgi:hypothetical protein